MSLRSRVKLYLSKPGGLAALICLALAAALLLDAGAMADGIRRGLAVSAGILVPSLFPFMALSGFLALTDAGKLLASPLRGLTRRVFKLPEDMGVAILFSMIGGYPIGAKMTAEMLESGRISPSEAERAMRFCINAGPPFLITAVGAGMFLDRKAGLILLLTQLAASIIIGAVTAAGESAEPSRPKSFPPRRGMRAAPAFVKAVAGGASSMLTLCAFATLFAGLLEMANRSGLTARAAFLIGADKRLADAVLAGILEVTSGCLAASSIGGSLGFGLSSAFISFSGISVLFQARSFFGDSRVRMAPMVIARLAHAAISTAMAVPLYNAFYASAAAWSPTAPPLMLSSSRTVPASLCLLGMCVVLTLSLRRTTKE